MKLQRLSGRKVNDYLRRKGKVFKSSTFVIRWLPGSPRGKEAGFYVGTYASAKLHKSAVKRNRMRRRCREALRRAVKERGKLPSLQLLITPRSSSLSCEFQDIENDISRFLEMV